MKWIASPLCLLTLAPALTAAVLAADAVAQRPARPAQSMPVELPAQRKPTIITNGSCFIRGGTVMTVSHGDIKNGDILIEGGKITEVGPNLTPPAGITVIDAVGKFITPGIVDAHEHIALDTINEGTDVVTPEVSVRDVIDPYSLSIYRGLSSGVTSTLLLHGSANAIGGQSVVVKMKFGKPADELPVPDAPRMVKFALGENPTQMNFGGFRQGPQRYPRTRMGVESVYRRAFAAAKQYQNEWAAYNAAVAAHPELVPPRRDLRLQALSDILERKLWVQCHCYRADEILMLLRLSKEYGFKLATLHHALEAYKILPEIKASGVGVSTFSQDWAYKAEAYDAIPYNAAMCMDAGIVTSVNSDNTQGSYHLNVEAARCIPYGRLSEQQALKLITINAAIQLGIDHRTGTLDVGKDGDVVIWSGDPLSNFSRCELTMIEGDVYFQRHDAFGCDATATIKNHARMDPVDPLALAPLRSGATYAITGGTVHTMAGPVIPNGTVVLHDGRIQAVGAHVLIPHGAIRVDARGEQVYPGLIDAGSHIGLTEVESIASTQDDSEIGAFQPDITAATAVNASSAIIPVTRVSGITTTQTEPASGGGFRGGGAVIGGQGSLITLAGWTTQQMDLKQHLALHVNYPAPISADRLEQLRQFLPPAQVAQMEKAAGANQAKLNAFFEKAQQYDAMRSAAGNQVPLDVRLEAMRPYLHGALPVIFHANSAAAIRDAVTFAGKFHLKPIIADAAEAWRVAPLLASKHIPVLYQVPISDSLGNVTWESYDPYDTPYACVEVLHRAGVQVAFESEDASSARNLPAQVGMLCAFGLPHNVAIEGLTTTAAEILGVGNEIGALKPGMRGDVIVTSGDPMSITSDVDRLFIGGKPVTLQTRQTRLYEKYSRRLAEIPGARLPGTISAARR
ncbi:MAG: amidohydrolase family protein [Armatimonadetes bacterium]|nr:amidohydrolase family protein [Armatimonadota bacterium]MDE2206000.1 amidohydrolase family protein [Armatimonadota bacterium]